MISSDIPDSGDKSAWLEYFKGSYQSSWRFLVISSRSNLINSVHWTSQLISIFFQQIKKNTQDGEIYHNITTLYQQFLAGPLLGTIILASAAIETFFRIALRGFLEKDLTKESRARGTSEDILKSLSKFDDYKSIEKLDFFYKIVLNRRSSSNLRDEFRYLFKFRNDCFHSDAVLRLKNGHDETIKRGIPRNITYSRGIFPEYPLLWSSNRPLSLTNALRSIRVHDNIIKDLFTQSDSKYLFEVFDTSKKEWEDLDKIESESYINRSLMKQLKIPEDLDKLSHLWDEFVESGLSGITNEEKEIYQRDLLRKINIKRVK